MKPFYNSAARLQSLRFHGAELVGTPFVPHAMVPGAGVDCVHVNAWCYLKSGFMEKFEPPKYAMDSGSHSKESQLLKWLDGRPDFQRIQDSPPAAGDTICFRMGLSEHHVGVMIDETHVLHCVFFGPKTTIISDLAREDYYRRRVSAIFRPMEAD